MTAILTRDGRLYTVGANASGQLGRNGTVSDARLGQVSFSGKIRSIRVGHDHMLVLDANGVLWGVGNNSYGQIRASASSTTSFVRVADHVTAMAAGRRSTLYIDENARLYGLGDNRWNKMVAGGGDRLTEPKLLQSGVVAVTAGEHESLSVTENGDLYYAGWRSLYGFSQGGGNNPAFVKLMSGVASASVYFGDVAILSESGAVYVYGLNNGGSIGSAVTNGTPRRLDVGDDVIAVPLRGRQCPRQGGQYLRAGRRRAARRFRRPDRSLSRRLSRHLFYAKPSDCLNFCQRQRVCLFSKRPLSVILPFGRCGTPLSVRAGKRRSAGGFLKEVPNPPRTFPGFVSVKRLRHKEKICESPCKKTCGVVQ